MKGKPLRELLAILRENGVTRYKARGLELDLGTAPAKTTVPSPVQTDKWVPPTSPTAGPVPPQLAELGLTASDVEKIYGGS